MRFFPGCAVVLAFAASAPLAGQQAAPSGTASGIWTGVVINATCTPEEAFAEAEKCVEPEPGVKFVLFNDTTRKIYSLEPQSTAASHLGGSVTVRGTLADTTIRVSSLEAITSFGLPVGRKAPAFSLRDQSGRVHTLETLKGSKGTVLLFVRSADWCPYCKGQLVQLQSAKARFEQQGLKLAAISYDSQEIMKFFADRRKIDFPLLADPESQVIRAYDVLNAEAVGQNKGMSRPGYFLIDPSGVIREKFFEAKYRERLTGNNLLTRMFPALGDQVTDTVAAPHLELAMAQSDLAGVPGNMITLTAEVRLPPDVHVYAPGTKGYKPIVLTIDSIPELDARPIVYPRSKILYLPAIKERVPVFEGTFRIRQDVKINSSAAFSNSLGADGKTVAIKGTLAYQACDSTICYLPTSVPVTWNLQILPLDRQRAPEDIRHK